MCVRPIQSREFSRRRRTILPLLGGEGRGEVEGSTNFSFQSLISLVAFNPTTDAAHMPVTHLKVCFIARPPPKPLPRGEGTAHARFRFIGRPSGQSRRLKFQRDCERITR